MQRIDHHQRSSHHGRAWRDVPLGMLIVLAAASPAHAVVATRAESSINVANAAIAYSYNIDAQLGSYNGGGAQSWGGCSGACAASGLGSTSTASTLTASFDQTQMAFNGQATASASANADLASGTVGINVTGSYLDVAHTGGQDGGTGTGTAIANDLLHFSVAGASASTVTLIGVDFTISGTIAYAGIGQEQSSDVFAQLNFGNGLFHTEITANSAQPPAIGATAAGNWVSDSIAPNTPGQIAFHGIYALTGATADIGFQEVLSGMCGGGDACSYAASVALSLPANAAFTSDSGVFLTAAPVPEPGAASLLLAGLGCLAWRRRRATRR